MLPRVFVLVTFLTSSCGDARRLASISNNLLGRSSSPRTSSSSKDNVSIASLNGSLGPMARALPNVVPSSWTEPQDEDQLEELSKQQEGECATLSNRAWLLWAESNDTDLDSEDGFSEWGVVKWNSDNVATAASLSFAESEREVVSDERQQRLHDPANKEDYMKALGVTTPRVFETSGQSNETPNSFGTASLRGQHSKNEDALFWWDTFNVAVLGVFDGHGGVAASALAARSMLRWLPVGWAQQLAQDSHSEEFWHDHVRLDLMCTQRLLREESNPRIGSTGSVVVVDKIGDASMTAHVFWLGDSQVLQARVIGDRWEQVFFSTPHDCAHDAEWRRRVDDPNSNCSKHKENAPVNCDESGGKAYTQYGKLKHRIGVTRSLGDFHLRDVGLVIDDPEIHVTDVMPGDLLLVASDGFWDAFGDPLEVLHVLNEKIGPSAGDCRTNLDVVSTYLAALAKVQYWDFVGGYQDDISVLLWCAPSPSTQDQRTDFVNNAVLAKDWLAGGNIGDRCVVLQERTGVFAMQKSTCADLQVSSNKIIDLKCYDPESGERPAIGEFGVCALPRKRQCFPDSGLRNGGCRAGLFCSTLNNGKPYCERSHFNPKIDDDDVLDKLESLGFLDRKEVSRMHRQVALDDNQVWDNPQYEQMLHALRLGSFDEAFE